MTKASCLLVIGIGLCVAPRRSTADTILFNDYGPGYTYQTNTQWAISGPTSAPGSIENANEFTPVTTGVVTSVAFGLSRISGTNSVTVAIAEDNAGTPGAILESFSFVDQMKSVAAQNPPLTATSVAHPLLTAGTTYFLLGIAGASDTLAGLNLNDQGATGTIRFSKDGGATWTTSPSTTLGAFEIFGTAAAVPEPSSVILLGLGAAVASAFVGRRARRPTRSHG